MNKRFCCALSVVLVLVGFTGCRGDKDNTSSSVTSASQSSSSPSSVLSDISSISSDNTSSKAEPNTDTGWSDLTVAESAPVTKDFIIQSGEWLYYCAFNGGVYKQRVDGTGLQKVYTDNQYSFFSVSMHSENILCVGYRKTTEDSNFLLLDLKNKSIRRVIEDKQFDNMSIYDLNLADGAYYFLANPDRYHRYVLYKKSATGEISALARGVSEYTISHNKLFYSQDNHIYSCNFDGSNPTRLLAPEQSMLGFKVFKNVILFTQEDETKSYIAQDAAPVATGKLFMAWDGLLHDQTVYFPGMKQGIYTMNLENRALLTLSDVVVSDIAIAGDYIYMTPSSIAADVDSALALKGSIYRMKLDGSGLEKFGF